MSGQFEQSEKVEEKPRRDPVADWRYTECLRIVGHDYALAFATSKIDLHRLETLAASGASPRELADWLL